MHTPSTALNSDKMKKASSMLVIAMAVSGMRFSISRITKLDEAHHMRAYEGRSLEFRCREQYKARNEFCKKAGNEHNVSMRLERLFKGVIPFSHFDRVYMDYAGATPVLEEALEAMRTAVLVGNPGALHKEGEEARESISSSREAIAGAFGVKAERIFFTSGGTESNNLAIIGYFRRLKSIGVDTREAHWVAGSMEHPSVLECFKYIEMNGGRVTYLSPDGNGIYGSSALANALLPETVFVSLGWANGEIGTVQPVHSLARAAHARSGKRRIIFHSDAGQAPLYLSRQFNGLGADIITLDSGKLYGPRGIGALYIAEDVELEPLILGGSQEKGLRAGTENTALAAGFAASLSSVVARRSKEAKRLFALKERLRVLLEGIGAVVNGSRDLSLPHILNVSIPEIDSEYFVLSLDHKGIAAATKSACREGEDTSHVVASLGKDKWRARNTIRLSLGIGTTARDVERVAKACEEIYRSMRARGQ